VTKSTANVFRGFLKLTDEEKRELRDEGMRYLEGDKRLRESIEIEVAKISVGPVGGVNCLCCGR